MNKIDLKFGEKTFTAKFGIGFIGAYLKASGQKIEEMFLELQNNPLYVAPNLLFHAIKKGTPEAELTVEQVEDMIDADGGVSSPQLMNFINAFSASLTTTLPETVGKPKRKKAVH